MELGNEQDDTGKQPLWRGEGRGFAHQPPIHIGGHWPDSDQDPADYPGDAETTESYDPLDVAPGDGEESFQVQTGREETDPREQLTEAVRQAEEAGDIHSDAGKYVDELLGQAADDETTAPYKVLPEVPDAAADADGPEGKFEEPESGSPLARAMGGLAVPEPAHLAPPEVTGVPPADVASDTATDGITKTPGEAVIPTLDPGQIIQLGPSGDTTELQHEPGHEPYTASESGAVAGRGTGKLETYLEDGVAVGLVNPTTHEGGVVNLGLTECVPGASAMALDRLFGQVPSLQAAITQGYLAAAPETSGLGNTAVNDWVNEVRDYLESKGVSMIPPILHGEAGRGVTIDLERGHIRIVDGSENVLYSSEDDTTDG